MSVSWQTGEPPCGVELLIEYRGATWTRRVVSTRHGVGLYCVDGVNWMIEESRILRWSTLDDDPAAKAIGSLEKMLSDETSWPWVCLEKTVCNDSYEATRYDDDGNERKRRAPSLIESIEKLTEVGNDSR